MKTNEKRLFKELCNFKSEQFDTALLREATPTVLGHLFFNRMQAVAYGNLKSRGLIGSINREFRNSLKGAYEQNIEKNRSYFHCVRLLSEALAECTCQYAMLKGAFLCRYYPEGYRTSNDIDLLVLPQDVTEIGEVLSRAGFQQGNIKDGTFVPATRSEIITSKMMRGETVPYIKQVNLPGITYLEVDVNFSLDYKNGDTVVLKDILSRATLRKLDAFEVKTLEQSDFFIHLCSHLYKEATTLPWVEMMRDMTLYKYCDLYLLLEDMSEEEAGDIMKRSLELNMSDICAFAIVQTAELFDSDNRCLVEWARSVLQSDPDCLHRVVSPKDRKTFVYSEKDVCTRFFCERRADLLMEV